MKREYVHIEKTTLPLAISIESNCASYDTNNDVDGDSEQVGGCCTVSKLWLGVSINPDTELMKSADTWFMMVGRNNENAYRGPFVPAYITTEREFDQIG